MSQENDQFSTPYRGSEEKEAENTGFKHGEDSHIRHEEESSEGNRTLEEQLNSYEDEIKEKQKRLKQIVEEKQKCKEGSEQYRQLDQERRVIRKELIDIDHYHKQLCARYKKQNEEVLRKQFQDKERGLLQEQAFLKNKKEEESGKSAQSHVNESQAEKEQQVKQEQPEAQETEKTQAQKSLEEQEIEARHKARVAEIEAELASERLRRSRQIELETELVRIRIDYPLYYDTYPYPLYPLGASYLYPSLRYSRYPYLYDPLLSPYRRYYPLYPYI